MGLALPGFVFTFFFIGENANDRMQEFLRVHGWKVQIYAFVVVVSVFALETASWWATGGAATVSAVALLFALRSRREQPSAGR